MNAKEVMQFILSVIIKVPCLLSKIRSFGVKLARAHTSCVIRARF